MASPTVYFTRHGQTDWNVAYRLQGQQDIPINETGRQQAANNGRRLKELLDDPSSYRFVASPLGRTRETMNIIRRELGLPIHDYDTDDRLKEISFGLWETYTFEEREVDNADAVAAREEQKWSYAPPLGESYERLETRVESWWRYVQEDTVVVCHGGILRVLERMLNGTEHDDAVHMEVPQDRICKWTAKDGGVWL